MHHFDNLIVSMALTGMMLFFVKSILNSIYPGAGDKFLAVLKKLSLVAFDLMAWVLKFTLSHFHIDFNQKRLPGRR